MLDNHPNPVAPVFSLRTLGEVARLFSRLGATAFGGPAASIAMMRDEAVARREWLDDQHFLDLLGAANLLPGPTASKVSMYLGLFRAGLPGLIVAGVCFTLPAMLMMLALAWAYVEFGTTPTAEWLLYGIKPVIIPLIALALWGLGRQAVKSALTGVVGMVVLVLYLAGINVVILLVGGGLVTMLAQHGRDLKQIIRSRMMIPLPLSLSIPVATAGPGFSLVTMFLVFIKVGAMMYGSGYVLFAFLRADLVEHHGWLSEQQLIDAIAVGQIKPGPLSTSVTFIGYVLGGVPGAILATVGIYLPAFLFVAISNPLVPRLRNSSWSSGLLDGVNVAAMGLMAGVTWQLAHTAFPDAFAVLVGLVAAGLLLRYQVNSLWLVLFGAAMGWFSAAF